MEASALVGRNVRRLRLADGLSQEETAHRAAMDRTYLSDIERGLANPSVQMLCDLAAALGVHPAVFLLSEEAAGLIAGLPSPQRDDDSAA